MTEKQLPALAAYYTLGCKLNFAETSTIGKMMESRGIHRAKENETPDICIVNTCSVTDVADKKGRRLLRHLARLYPQATIVATGCYAQLKPAEVASIPGVDIVLGSDEKLRIGEFLDRWLDERRPIMAVTPMRDIRAFRPSCERGDRTRYFLKVQDGCDYFCTYCTIPFARGRSRSGSIAEITDMARSVATEGGREIVLTGVNTGDFGKGTEEDFFGLIRSLDQVEGIERFRISSIEPNLLTPEMIRWVAQESRRFMPHFHIPLQSGSDAVLRLMNRRYDTALFAERIAMIREFIPDAYIGVDIIAGARGETSQEWERSLEFARSLPISKYHCFPYSERPGTRALQLADAVSQEEKHRRIGVLTALSEEKNREFMHSQIGRRRPVLWEHPQHGHAMMSGFTDNYIRVEAPASPDMPNTVTTVELTGLHPRRPDTMLIAPAET